MPERSVEGGTADKEVIREDESVVFTPLLCNNKDRIRCGTKGNDGLYTAQSFRAAYKETLLDPRLPGPTDAARESNLSLR